MDWKIFNIINVNFLLIDVYFRYSLFKIEFEKKYGNKWVRIVNIILKKKNKVGILI